MPYEPGDILNNKYRIEKLIGQGAFGEVYLVTNLTLRARRALKVLKRVTPGIGKHDYSEFQKSFKLEAQLGAMLNTPTHPNLLQVHDLVQDGDMFLLEMEYVPGGDLEKRIHPEVGKNQVLPIPDAIRIGSEIADGLAVLHTHQVVHRDLKPSNILFDNLSHAKLADFGLAQAPNDLSQREKRLSDTPPHPGTFGYKSPEQENSVALLTPASDIYALGVVIFEMLTGLSYKPGLQASHYRPETPPWLDDLLSRMLSKDPEQRPRNGEEAGKLMRAGSFPEPLPKSFLARYWLIEVLGALGLLGVVLLLGVMVGGYFIFKRTAAAPALFGSSTATRPSLRAPTALPTFGVGSTLTRSVDGMQMVYVPAGSFTMGDSADQALSECQKYSSGCQKSWFMDEEPAHTVTLSAFWIDQTEVTNGEYALCVQNGACRTPFSNSSATRANYYTDSQYADFPVVNVDWNQAATYCSWTGGRLPSEAEWEKAARGPDERTYPWGEGLDESQANFSGSDTTRVGSFPSGVSLYGAYDLAGNVLEWVNDWYDSSYYGYSRTNDPQGPVSRTGHVVRGGSWNYSQNLVRSANRSWNAPDLRGNYLGFRCAHRDSQ